MSRAVRGRAGRSPMVGTVLVGLAAMVVTGSGCVIGLIGDTGGSADAAAAGPGGAPPGCGAGASCGSTTSSGAPGCTAGCGGATSSGAGAGGGAASTGGSAGAADGGMGGDGATGGTAGAGGGDPIEAARQACVDKVNELRALEGAPPLTRWKAKEPCVDGQVQADIPNDPHGSWGQCGETGQNGAWGGAPLMDFVLSVTQSMFDAGPGEVHHDQMVDTWFTKMACGLAWSTQTNWAMYQDFFH